MLVILDYENYDSDLMKLILDDFQYNYKFSLLEEDIIRAHKIILPDPVDIRKSYRKINLMNLTSVLRMVKCPILGLNNGLSLMCKQFSDKNGNGLCLFDMNYQVLSTNNDSAEMIEGSLEIIKNTKLVDESYSDYKVYMDSDCHPIVNENSKILINSNEKKYSLLYEQGDYLGLILNVTKNKKIFSNLLKNFTRLVK